LFCFPESSRAATMTENEQKAVQLVAEADKKINSKGTGTRTDVICN
jgi:adenosylcobinamide amidohydrolase